MGNDQSSAALLGSQCADKLVGGMEWISVRCAVGERVKVSGWWRGVAWRGVARCGEYIISAPCPALLASPPAAVPCRAALTLALARFQSQIKLYAARSQIFSPSLSLNWRMRAEVR